jgi:aminotransferase
MLCASIVAQEAALEALLRGWDSVLQMREQYHRRRDLVVRRFNEIGLKCHSPRGSFYAFPDVTATGRTEKEFAVGLLEKEKVAVVPGAAFGPNGAGHVRACFATSYEQLIDACDRMDRFVNGAAKK